MTIRRSLGQAPTPRPRCELMVVEGVRLRGVTYDVCSSHILTQDFQMHFIFVYIVSW